MKNVDFPVRASTLRRIARRHDINGNMRSIVDSLDKYGQRFGLNTPWRVAQFLAQIVTETAYFAFDHEVWGPTPAQKRYDTRTDLGNTPEKDGDGKLRSGRGPFQLTGGTNEKRFTAWARAEIDPDAPDFYAHPEKINTDPWEGLSAIWFWTEHNLNRLADSGDIEQIRKIINGGMNGYVRSLEGYTRVAMAILGYSVAKSIYPAQIAAFQKDAKALGLYDGPIDSDPGPKTRAALHAMLVRAGDAQLAADSDIRMAPVVQHNPVPVAPKSAEKPSGHVGLGVGAIAANVITSFAGVDWRVQMALLAVSVIFVLLMIFGFVNIAAQIKQAKKAIQP